MSDVKITPSMRGLLERIGRQDGTLLELQVTSSGGRSSTVLSKLRVAGLAEMCDHPSVIDRLDGYPARAIRLTEAGRALLAERKPTDGKENA
jgi:hypothetical protein